MDMRGQILAVAQRLVQLRGFNGFSYADISKEVGIRKASLHHHFPSKVDLGVALIESYEEQLEAALLGIDRVCSSADEKLVAYVGIYRHSLEAERMCLGGMLATEALTLDEVMLPSLRHFFLRNIRWLANTLGQGESQQLFVLSGKPDDQARMLVAALQGALLLARATGDRETFEQTSRVLINGLMRKG
jgi:TetR/AcrR family transcriptional repressor of nem operon